MITENSLIRLKKKMQVSLLCGEKVMVDFESGKYFCLKGSANDIWDYLESKNVLKVCEIVDLLQKEYVVSKDECLEGTIEFLDELLSYQVIEVDSYE